MVKRALLVGCNYIGRPFRLYGCANDVHAMKCLLIEQFGFPPENITILLDCDPSYEYPTGAKIKEELRNMCDGAVAGDILVFHFSGHGTQIPSDDSWLVEIDGKDSALVPADINLIVDDDLRLIVSLCHPGVRFTMTADCCNSGGLLDGIEVPIKGEKEYDDDNTLIRSLKRAASAPQTSPKEPWQPGKTGNPVKPRHRDLTISDGAVTVSVASLSAGGRDPEGTGTAGIIFAAIAPPKEDVAAPPVGGQKGSAPVAKESRIASSQGAEMSGQRTSTAAKDEHQVLPPVVDDAKSNAPSTATAISVSAPDSAATLESEQWVLVDKAMTGPEAGAGKDSVQRTGAAKKGTSRVTTRPSAVITAEALTKEMENIMLAEADDDDDGLHVIPRFLGLTSLLNGLSETLGHIVDAAKIRPALEELFGSNASHMVHKYKEDVQKIATSPKLSLSTSAGKMAQPAVQQKPPESTTTTTTVCQRDQGPASKVDEPELETPKSLGVLITGCQRFEKSADACPSGVLSEAFGALTHAIVKIHKENPNEHFTNRRLVYEVRDRLEHMRYSQNPCLECSEVDADLPFIC
ncbi:hypothetical protein CBR_g81547 [Chara braunii]|uniref:Peptidase C14 caspase domain-containing protein n=1 Tax=Chara braunii TaxID=69332 RepID=A0A388KAZ8_CHABU|nr:hypothetical protein CBR_g81547 [Chara braunii]|eukprot:GBG67123.1 hypothetical protein CBR_g81547 [Chara braunii]